MLSALYIFSKLMDKYLKKWEYSNEQGPDFDDLKI